MKALNYFVLFITIAFLSACNEDKDPVDNLPNISGYPIVGTNQSTFYNNSTTISEPAPGEAFFGQDAHYPGSTPRYQENGDGTVTDMVTGLVWQSSFDHNNDGTIDVDDKLTYSELLDLVSDGVSFAGYDDWRLPSIKEQYSLILFSGQDISGYNGTSTEGLIPFIDTEAFAFGYGDLDAGERLIDMQCATTNIYVSTELEESVFGVNFADGRIKGYGTSIGGQEKQFNYLLVRGNTEYGTNQFSDNGDGTISDNATGLMWLQDDNGQGLNWEDALAYAENLEFAGHSDWRLPNAKELHSILDYSRSPFTNGTAAIDPLFNCSPIVNEAGQNDFPYYWSGTTHANMSTDQGGAWAAYFFFGRAMGNMQGWVDVHGAGSQSSDPKMGDPSDYSDGHGPQGDAVRIFNYVRPVRNL